jgi:pimeloyl-ACP methyl ester carboxylesterase
VVPQAPLELERYVEAKEASHRVKPDNEARIVWADSTHRKTPYSVVYLHGFSASHEEGDPVHEDFAKKFGCNLFLARLADHGIDTTEQLLYFTGDRFWESAKEALAIGRALGDRVVILSTSTGGTVALMLAAYFPDQVHALINLSPNIAINNPLAFLSNNPWGLSLTYQVVGKYHVAQTDSVRRRYWNDRYRVEAIAQLQEMLEDQMNATLFARITCPVLTLYYYKNEQEQDPQVKVSAMLEMHEQLGTPASQKQAIAVPSAGAHVLGSYLVSKDVPAVQRAMDEFAVGVLQWKAAEKP